MNFTIRKAELGDMPNMVELAVEMMPYSVSPFREVTTEEMKTYRRSDMFYLTELMKKPFFGVYVAEDPEKRFAGHVIVGCQQMESSTGEMQGWIFDISVKEEYWGSGVAARLMEKAEEFTRGYGHKYLGLGVTTSNVRAVKFYEKIGFAEERKRMLKKLDPKGANDDKN